MHGFTGGVNIDRSSPNAFTSAFKQLTPVKQFEATARLGAYLYDVTKFFGCRSFNPTNDSKSSKVVDFVTVDGTYRPIVGVVDESSTDDSEVRQIGNDDPEVTIDETIERYDDRAAA